jgi:filamentous hemagglutinin family protein
MNQRLMGICAADKNVSPKINSRKFNFSMALIFGACITTSAASYGAAALPTGGVVAAGTAAITQSGNVMNVNQTSQRAVVNWSTFDVAKGNTVNFNQPNANASTLNRVNSASQSMINGAVNANGQVVFVNPNGIVFGAGAQVNTGGLVATTMDVTDSEYMAGSGKMQFKGNGTGQILNQGKIFY